MSGPPPDVLAALGLSKGRTRPVPRGHINSTWLVGDCIVQRINRTVFADPMVAARRAQLVASELRAGALTVPQPIGAPVLDAEREVWRAYRYVKGRTPAGRAADRTASAAFGAFAAGLAHLDPQRVPVTIARFHDFGHRVRQLRGSMSAGRRRAPGDERRALALIGSIRRLREYRAWLHLPHRVVHNDAKRANVIRQPDGVLCIIDLDTVGAGSLLYDVGELIRSAVREDAARASLPKTRIEAVVAGYLSGWGQPLVAAESDALPIAGLMMATENAIRFLADYLDGDRYFAIGHPRHNLDRARAQLTLAELLLDAAQ